MYVRAQCQARSAGCGRRRATVGSAGGGAAPDDVQAAQRPAGRRLRRQHGLRHLPRARRRCLGRAPSAALRFGQSRGQAAQRLRAADRWAVPLHTHVEQRTRRTCWIRCLRAQPGTFCRPPARALKPRTRSQTPHALLNPGRALKPRSPPRHHAQQYGILIHGSLLVVVRAVRGWRAKSTSRPRLRASRSLCRSRPDVSVNSSALSFHFVQGAPCATHTRAPDTQENETPQTQTNYDDCTMAIWVGLMVIDLVHESVL